MPCDAGPVRNSICDKRTVTSGLNNIKQLSVINVFVGRYNTCIIWGDKT